MKSLLMAGISILMLSVIMKSPASAEVFLFDVLANSRSYSSATYHVDVADAETDSGDYAVEGFGGDASNENSKSKKRSKDEVILAALSLFGFLISDFAGSDGSSGGTLLADSKASPLDSNTEAISSANPSSPVKNTAHPAASNTFNSSTASNLRQRALLGPSLAPECSSLALLLPGLLPLGLVARRQRKANR